MKFGGLLKTYKMKNNLLILCAFFSTSIVFGQTCETTTIESGLDNPSLTITCDFNGDGSEDIVFLNASNDEVSWLENTGSDDFESAAPLIGGVEIRFLKAADFNGDGYDEIVIATASTIYYCIYTGPGDFDFDDLYTTPILYYFDALEVGDFDNDGSEGLVMSYSKTSTFDAQIDVLNNDDGSFSLQNIYGGTVGEIPSLAVGDISGNNRLDIASSGSNNFWFRNTGSGDFTTYNVISTGSSDFGDIALHDYNNDDDLDLIVHSYEGDLMAYGIDLTGEGWIYDPIDLLSGLPTDPQTWELTKINGEDVILLSSATDIIGLKHSGSSFTEVTYCSGITDLNGLTLLHREDGLIEFVFSREAGDKIEKMDDAETNDIQDLTLNSFEVYPNPTSNFVNIVSEKGTAISNVVVVNTFGQIAEVKEMANGHYSIEHLSSGLYQIVITDVDGNVFTKSIMKV